MFNWKTIISFLAERAFYYFLTFLTGVGFGYAWAVKAYGNGCFQ